MHSIGDIIFGKVAGFKWWPGKITKIEKTKDAKKCLFRVDFFEEKKKTYANLKEDRIISFSEGYNLYYGEGKKVKEDLLEKSIIKAYSEYKKKEKESLLKKKREKEEETIVKEESNVKVESEENIKFEVNTTTTEESIFPVIPTNTNDIIKCLVINQINRDNIYTKLISLLDNNPSKPHQTKEDSTQTESKPDFQIETFENEYLKDKQTKQSPKKQKSIPKINTTTINFLNDLKDFFNPTNPKLKKELFIDRNDDKKDIFKGVKEIVEYLENGSIDDMTSYFGLELPEGIKELYDICVRFELKIGEFFNNEYEFYIKVTKTTYIDDVILDFIRETQFEYEKLNKIGVFIRKNLKLYASFKKNDDIVNKIGNFIDLLLIKYDKKEFRYKIIDMIEKI